jgi:hypothetical protein
MTPSDRAAASDREKTQTPLSEALETCAHIGMPHHVEMIQALLDQPGGCSQSDPEFTDTSLSALFWLTERSVGATPRGELRL